MAIYIFIEINTVILLRLYLLKLDDYCCHIVFFWGGIMVVSFLWNNWPKLLYGVGHLWFLLMLFGVFTLTVSLQLLNAQRFRFTLVSGLVLIVCGYAFWHFLKHYNPNDILCLNRVLYYFPAFIVGYLCAKLRVGWLLTNWAYICLPLVVLLLFVFVWYQIPLPYGFIILIRTLDGYGSRERCASTL